MLQKQLEEDQTRNQVKVLGEIVDKYVQQVQEKNRKMVEVIRVKEEVEAKIQNNVNEAEIKAMQDELQGLIKQYEKLVGDKILIFSDLISNLHCISTNNQQII